jgi:hypothetical protein
MCGSDRPQETRFKALRPAPSGKTRTEGARGVFKWGLKAFKRYSAILPPCGEVKGGCAVSQDTEQGNGECRQFWRRTSQGVSK